MQIKRFGTFRNGLVGATALAALIAGAGFVSGPQGSAPANAEPLRLEAPLAMPSFADVVERVKPAVVSVRVEADAMRVSDDATSPRGRAIPDIEPGHPLYDFFRRFEEFGAPGPRGGAPEQGPRRGASQGSGFFVSEDGYVVTNNHVVGTAKEVEIVMDDGRTLPARVVGVDARTDLAVLKVDEQDDLPYVALSEGRSRIGDWVLAIGNPFGLGGTVTAGIVSAQARDIGAGPYDEFLQIDAPINRGNSGGPTFNLGGEVVGVNTAIYSPSGGNVGIAFAIPAHVVADVVSQLIENGEVTRGFLGVQIQPVTPEIADAIGLEAARGALVAQPQEGGPAARAGLRSGDVILSVDGTAIEDHRSLSRLIAGYEPGSTASVEIVRRGERKVIPVEVGRLNDA